MALTAQRIATALAEGAPVTWRATNVDRRGNLRPLGDSTSADLTRALVWESGDNPGLEGGRIDLDNEREVPRQATVRLDLARVPGGLTSIDHVQLWEDRTIPGDGPGVPAEVAEFSLGVFVPSFNDVTHSWDGRPVVTLQLHDLTAHLLDSAGEAYSQPLGTGYWDVLRDVVGTRLGMLTDFPTGGPVLPQVLSRPRDFRWYDIARDVTDGFNRYPAWPDALGRFRTRERIDPWAEVAAVPYTTAIEPRMVDAGAPYVRGLDVPLVDNRRVVVADFGAEHIAAPQYVILENADPTSPVSTANTPVRLGRELKADTRPSTRAILDRPTMLAIGRYELRVLAAQAQPARFDTFPDPRRTNRESYLLTVEGAETAQLARCVRWSRALKPGAPMTHEVQIVRPVAITERHEVEAEE